MSSIVERFLERPRSHQVGFWLASVGVLSLLLWQYLLSPTFEERQNLRDAVESLQSKVTQESRIARDLPRFREQVQELDRKLMLALRELPDQREIPDLLSAVSARARDAGLEVTTFQPRPEVKRDFYAEVPVAISVEGTYHQLATFFDDVGRMERIVNISGIEVWSPFFRDTQIVRGLAQPVSGKTSIRARCTATTFRYLDESERVKPEEEKTSKKRRKRGSKT